MFFFLLLCFVVHYWATVLVRPLSLIHPLFHSEGLIPRGVASFSKVRGMDVVCLFVYYYSYDSNSHLLENNYTVK